MANASRQARRREYKPLSKFIYFDENRALFTCNDPQKEKEREQKEKKEIKVNVLPSRKTDPKEINVTPSKTKEKEIVVPANNKTMEKEEKNIKDIDVNTRTNTVKIPIEEADKKKIEIKVLPARKLDPKEIKVEDGKVHKKEIVVPAKKKTMEKEEKNIKKIDMK